MYSAATTRLLDRAAEVFIDHGYATLTMAQLGELCGLQRRALYYHFHSKEDMFRAVLRVRNAHYQALADRVAAQALERDDSIEQVIGHWLDTRYGEFRRRLLVSPHAAELNTMAFAVGLDIMLDVARETNLKLQTLIAALVAQKRLRLRPGMTAERAAQMISDAARGVNQARPAIPADELAARYYAITEALLFGCALR
ncbi:TetR/AcrR family transcriptional regulator [Pararobbsia silviterrae]|uniref:TetR/AcrR family transcriptional regulator n=1 Tax=Pararobbsia silviterrae TaxID=1792498 RepID=UPI001314E173|nr:TetR/AcrR family transcriptional regulator [Pararobbsia silviterrae]